MPEQAGQAGRPRVGFPSLDAISARVALVSPRTTYQVLKTTEIDEYDAVRPPTLAPPGDRFRGTARKAAKLSIASAPVETFADLQDLVGSLPADNEMLSHKPRIKVNAASTRVAKEKRNVRVRTFLYAASREDDNDFHLILGRDPALEPELYMTMELSGLPPKSNKSHARLKTTRDTFKAFFGNNLPDRTYDFYDPPISVEIEGSLFFDMSHSSGQRPGPPSLKSRMPTIWEVHPIARIVFEP